MVSARYNDQDAVFNRDQGLHRAAAGGEPPVLYPQ